MNKCFNCKWFKEIKEDNIFHRSTVLTVCTNPETFQKNGTWWPDGNSVLIQNESNNIQVGSNFGCVNWESEDQSESQILINNLKSLLKE